MIQAAGPSRQTVSAFVLAGGRSSRMGRDKVWLTVEGHALIERAHALAQGVSDHVAILSGSPETAGNHERNSLLSCYAALVPDLIPDCGPLSGIHAALSHTGTEWNLILPVDVPFLPGSLLQRWIASCPPLGCDASWMRLGEQHHPLPLLLRRGLREPLEQQLRAGRCSIRGAIQAALAGQTHHRIAVFPVEQTRASERWFANLNTPADLFASLRNSTAALSSNQTGAVASE